VGTALDRSPHLFRRALVQRQCTCSPASAKNRQFSSMQTSRTTTNTTVTIPGRAATGTITVTKSVASSQITGITSTESPSSPAHHRQQFQQQHHCVAGSLPPSTAMPQRRLHCDCGGSVSPYLPSPQDRSERLCGRGLRTQHRHRTRQSHADINSSSQQIVHATSLRSPECNQNHQRDLQRQVSGNGVTASGGTITASNGTNNTNERAWSPRSRHVASTPRPPPTAE